MTFFDRVVGWYYRKLFSPVYAIILRLTGIDVGHGVIFFGRPLIKRFRSSRISIGDHCVFCSDARFTALGISSPTVIKTIQEGAVISIDMNCGMSGGMIIATKTVSIGQNCLIGGEVTIIDSDFHPIQPSGRRSAPLSAAASREVTIGNNCFLGMRCVIFKGISIGDNSVIAAGELVRRDVPRDSIIIDKSIKKL